MTPVAYKASFVLIVLVATTVLVTGAMAQMYDDPRNQSDEYWDALNGGQCYACHDGQGFTAGTITFPERPIELAVDTDYDLKLRYTHDSGKNQEIRDLRVVVNTSAAPNIEVLGPDAPEDLERAYAKVLAASDTLRDKLTLDAGIEEAYIGIIADASPTGGPLAPNLEARLLPDGEGEIPFEGRAHHRFLRLGPEAVRDHGEGNFYLDVKWNDTLGLQPEVEVQVTLFVNRTQTETEFVLHPPPGTKLYSGDSVTIAIPLRVTAPGPAALDLRVESVSYWQHQAGDAAPRDDGVFYRFATVRFSAGSETLTVQGANAPVPVAVNVDLYSLFARIIGFTTLILVPAALVTGGVFGKTSRRWMNRVTGGAKKRVLWHGAMSWMIIALASGHFALALVEGRFAWTKGLLWGGLGWALLVSLGFTGYYQVRMIKRWNYRTWRHTHLWSAVAVLAFGVSHMLLDGSSLAAVRDALGDWVDLLVWP